MEGGIAVPPILEEHIKNICTDLLKASQTPNVERIVSELKTKKYPVTAQTGRLIAYYLGNSNIVEVLTREIESNKKDVNKIEKSPASKKQKLNNDNKPFTSETSNLIPAIPPVSIYLTERPTSRISDLAGIEPIITKLRELIFNPIYLNIAYQYIGIIPTCTILLCGPTGCGKTALANAIAGELNLPFFFSCHLI